jgi:hypothetical protein
MRAFTHILSVEKLDGLGILGGMESDMWIWY